MPIKIKKGKVVWCLTNQMIEFWLGPLLSTVVEFVQVLIVLIMVYLEKWSSSRSKVALAVGCSADESRDRSASSRQLRSLSSTPPAMQPRIAAITTALLVLA